MRERRESLPHTFAMAIGTAVACSLLVTLAVQYFRPMQLAYASLDRNRVIVRAGGLLGGADVPSDREIAGAFRDLEVRLVDLRSGEFSAAADPLTYDQVEAAQTEAGGAPIPADRDLARLGRRAHYAPVYIRREAGRIERIVLPVYGQGMWSTISGYLALGPDLSTIEALHIYRHGETPGIGDRIEDPAWLAKWSGKMAFDQDGAVRIGVAAGGSDAKSAEAAYTVDAISGATVTTDGVTRMVRFWLGPDGFGPFLDNLRGRGIAEGRQ